MVRAFKSYRDNLVKAFTFRRYWAWWIAFAWLLGYEGWAFATNHTTLSRMTWTATERWPVLPFVVAVILILLMGHFWFGWWDTRKKS